MTTLPITNVINVSILSALQGLMVPNINTCALFTKETASDWDGAAYKIYTNATDVGTSFGTTSKAYKIAVAFFAQQPNVLTTNGYLVIIKRLHPSAWETVPEAITRTENLVYYYGVLVDEILTSGEIDALAEAVQAIDKMAFYADDDPAYYAEDGVFDLVRQASETHFRCLFYNRTGKADIEVQQFAAAYAGRGLSTNFSGSLTCQTMHLKSLATILPDDSVDQTALDACQLAGVDVYISLGGVTGVSCVFISGANAWFDTIYNQTAFKFELQTAGFNYLRQTNSKIPQTEIGMEGLKSQYRHVCDQFVFNGFLAPGAWTSPDVFGDPATLIRSVKDIGYYVYSLPVAKQSGADKSARKAPLVQIAGLQAGAIQSSSIIGIISA